MVKADLSKNKGSNELVERILFLLGALVVYRLGTHIPVPGINADQLSSLFSNNSDGLLGIFNMFSGGAVSRFSIFALGIMPYISAAIVMQLLTYTVPSLSELRKEGESGRKKITKYTRYGTFFLALVQSYFITIGLESQQGLVNDPGYLFRLISVTSLTTGTMFLMWLGEQITEKGLGNGISLIIFAGIVAGLPQAIAGLLELVNNGSMHALIALIIAALVVLVTAFVVFVERGQRRILITHARNQATRRGYSPQQSHHLPLKLNMAGVIPPIFASSIILFPATIAGWLARDGENVWLSDLVAILAPGQPAYILIYAAAIMFFCFFYTALIFNSKETADNLRKGGALVPGIRPGSQTAHYLDKVLLRLTLVGAIYIVLICLLPEFLRLKWNVPFYFGGTSLLIIVVVTMDFMVQAQSHLMSHHYESLLKKADFKSV